MAYAPQNDFLALLRNTAGGERLEAMPGLDFVVAALARAGMISLSVGQLAPTSNQITTAWFKPAVPSWAVEGVLYLWNASTSAYQVASPALWSSFLAASTTGATPVVQDVAIAGPSGINTSTTILRVLNVGAPVTLVLPAASTKIAPVLVLDWANLAGTNNILVQRTGSDVFPNGSTGPWTIASDGGSVLFRPVPGGYAA